MPSDFGRITLQRKIMKVSELIDKLKTCDLEAEVWLPNVNELGIPGYCVLDHVINMTFGEVVEDVMNNPREKKQTRNGSARYRAAFFVTTAQYPPFHLLFCTRFVVNSHEPQ